MIRQALTVAIALLLGSGGVAAQTTTNPDVSLVGDLRAIHHNDVTRPSEADRLHLADPELELVIGGYLNPYARADGTFAWHDGENAEIEEAFVTFLRGLPWDLQVVAGLKLLDFGRLNPVHHHAYSFIQQPLPHREFFGEEGLRDMTVRVSALLPTGSAHTELALGWLQGDLLLDHDHDHEEEPGTEEAVAAGLSGRLSTSLAVSEHAELALGLSGVTAIHDPEEDLRAWLGGAEFKYRWKPSRYTSLTLEGEVLLNRRDSEDGSTVSTHGGFAYIDYQFRQRYNIGVITEYAESRLAADEQAWRAGLFLGFAPVEETSRLRLAGHWNDPATGDAFWETTLQLVFSLGPHRPHTF